jgi:hypothetical protein
MSNRHFSVGLHYSLHCTLWCDFIAKYWPPWFQGASTGPRLASQFSRVSLHGFSRGEHPVIQTEPPPVCGESTLKQSEPTKL